MRMGGQRIPRRPDWGAAPIVVGLAVVAYLTIALVADLPRPPAEFVIVAVPSIYGAVFWLVGGAPLIAALSWTVPLAAWMAVNAFVVPRPFGLIGLLLGVWVVYRMITSTRTMEWWVRTIFRGRTGE